MDISMSASVMVVAPGDFLRHGPGPQRFCSGSIRASTSQDAAGYQVPADNPYVDSTGVRPELWSYGVRKPWRFSFDRTTRDLYIGDVGEDSREESTSRPRPTAAARVSTSAGACRRARVCAGWLQPAWLHRSRARLFAE
jgi:hypothetical protein